MLALLLDEHISQEVARQVRAKHPEIPVISLGEWRDGQFLSRPDDEILAAAAEERRTLVTYDVKTISPLLVALGLAGIDHAGVVFVDNLTIASSNLGGLVAALIQLWSDDHRDDWTNAAIFLRPRRR